ncbi:hypothetical protein R3P38DRAFT_2771950 [Favolaschia claudopus]|uniref:Uncharacterized protein n=1 Tax=Favolaschia claudopus TaxID=2862362 RepID=A0AAW0BH19_9AGAR
MWWTIFEREEPQTTHLHVPGKGFIRKRARRVRKRTQEAIARIRMNVDNFDKSQTKVAAENLDAHWAFGAPLPGHLAKSRALEELTSGPTALGKKYLKLKGTPTAVDATPPVRYLPLVSLIFNRSPPTPLFILALEPFALAAI